MDQSKEIVIQDANIFLATLLEGEDASIIPQITPIVIQNIKIGRFDFYSTSDLGISNYIMSVIQNYKKNHNILFEIQIEKSDVVWIRLLQQMITFAYKFFLWKGYPSDSEIHDIAEECAIDASIFLINARFPYDCDIDAWINVIVRRSCLKYMRSSYSKSKIPNSQISSFNDDVSIENIPDAFSVETITAEKTIRTLIGKYISELSGVQQKVIKMYYLDNMAVDEIAKLLNKNVSSIYSIHFRALEQLNKLCRDDDNLNVFDK